MRKMNKRKYKINWKQNLRKIPDWILEKAKRSPSDHVVVACVRKLKAADILAGVYSHLSIYLDSDKPTFSASLIPDPRVGKYSKVNVHGEEIIRKDLPMVTKTYSWDTPNFGDWSHGSHEISIDRQVYRRDFISPKELELRIELLGEEVKEEKVFVFKFLINEVLSRMDRSFKDALLSNLNLLQENAGAVDIFSSEATRDDYLKTIYVSWDILPPGERDTTIAKILAGFKAPTEEIRKKLVARYNLLAKLKPLAFIRGTSSGRPKWICPHSAYSGLGNKVKEIDRREKVVINVLIPPHD